MEEKTISIAYIFFFIALAVFIALVVWWALGDSPTVEMLSLGATAVGSVLAWIGIKQADKTDKIHYAQTQMLKTILERLK